MGVIKLTSSVSLAQTSCWWLVLFALLRLLVHFEMPLCHHPAPPAWPSIIQQHGVMKRTWRGRCSGTEPRSSKASIRASLEAGSAFFPSPEIIPSHRAMEQPRLVPFSVHTAQGHSKHGRVKVAGRQALPHAYGCSCSICSAAVCEQAALVSLTRQHSPCIMAVCWQSTTSLSHRYKKCILSFSTCRFWICTCDYKSQTQLLYHNCVAGCVVESDRKCYYYDHWNERNKRVQLIKESRFSSLVC